ncbi:MAG: prepilin-type N-terminal cleavage/methylation domain-containing protein [Planctomycetes bacterium]|nr:prepilin-type N-terminal cleavage/methylation domain-containing protein [Planctomycetota bacterium]
MNQKHPQLPRPTESGFTLIEIMVVIVIIGLLATLVVPNVVGASKEARIQTARSNCNSLAASVKLYFTFKGRLPDSLEALTSEEDKDKSWYVENLGKDPWDNAYELREGNGRNDWEIVSAGPNGQMNDDDDVSNKMKKEN